LTKSANQRELFDPEFHFTSRLIARDLRWRLLASCRLESNNASLGFRNAESSTLCPNRPGTSNLGKTNRVNQVTAVEHEFAKRRIAFGRQIRQILAISETRGGKCLKPRFAKHRKLSSGFEGEIRQIRLVCETQIGNRVNCRRNANASKERCGWCRGRSRTGN
jgi:hypothetical protein